MSLTRYPEYKPSGVEWLGEVPGHWDVRKIRWLCQIKKRISGELGHDVLSITQQGIKIKDLESNDGQISMDYSKYQFVEIGDFAMNHMDLLTGYVDISSVFGVTSPDYRVFFIRDKKDCYDRYVLYLFQMGYRNKIFYAFGQGSSQLGRWRLPTEQFNDFLFPLPPVEEQQTIAAFLDRETGKIDALIAEQRRLVELLAEKRQAVISHAVTKGLNPNAPMKNSGIEWLGEVPEHWDVKRVKQIFNIGRGRVIAQDELIDDGLYPVFSSQTLDNGCLGYINTFDFDCKQITWTTDGANAGTVFLREGKHNCTNVCGTLQVKDDSHLVEYVCYFLGYATQFYKRPDTNGAKIMNNEMAEIVVSLPPLAEQQTIAAYLGTETAKFDILTAGANRAIELLQERRSALISAAVTGKVDVRKIA